MAEFEVSVIIPVYKAREYVREAVESALAQPETGEVILVEDGSPDRSLEVCKALAEESQRVRLVQHADGKNHGAAASRNLGIRNAHYPFIAFLDADDYYLEGRFAQTVQVLRSHPCADGVYEAIGAAFEDADVKDEWAKLPLEEVTTVRRRVPPEDLFAELLSGGSGYFHFDGLVVRKQVFESVGYFNENLKMMEDTDMMYRLAAKCRLYPGSIDNPVAIRRVHQGNRITKHLLDSRAAYCSIVHLWDELHKWGRQNLSEYQLFLLSCRHVERLRKVDYLEDASLSEVFQARKEMLRIAISSPRLLFTGFLWRMMTPSLSYVRNSLQRLRAQKMAG